MYKLVQALALKSVVEVLMIAGLVVYFYMTTFNPFVRGWLDKADAHVASGWALDVRKPGAKVEVQLYVDGKFVANLTAADPRPDLVRARVSPDETHGYTFNMPSLDSGDHEAEVYAAGGNSYGTIRTLQRLGDPIRFHSEP